MVSGEPFDRIQGGWKVERRERRAFLEIGIFICDGAEDTVERY
jgi:hypothetical protein